MTHTPENDHGKWWIGNDDTDPLHTAENDAPPVGRCIGCFHDFRTGPCGGCGAIETDGPARLHMPGCILDPDHGAGCVRQQWAASDPTAPWNRDIPPEKEN